MVVVVTAEALVVALLVVLVAGLLRSHAEILARLHELGMGIDPDADVAPAAGSALVRPRRAPGVPATAEEGEPARDIVGTTPGGESVAVGVAGAGHRTLLCFLSTGCSTCAPIWRSLPRPPAYFAGPSVRIVAVVRDASRESTSALASLAPPGVTVVLSSAAWDDYAVPGAPYFVYVDGPSARVVGEGSAMSLEQLAGLVGGADADAAAVAPTGSRKDRYRPAASTRVRGAIREERIDGELARSGILPGDPSLYPARIEETVSGAPAPR